MSKVMVFGTFDGLHLGHIDFINQALIIAEKLIVIVARDKNVYKIKGHYPKYTENKRLAILKEKYKNNHKIQILFGQVQDPYRVIEKYKPDTICLGYDQSGFSLNLSIKYPSIKIFRLKPFYPKKYKSSLLNKL